MTTNDAVWVMLHSGSRNIGKELAELPHRDAQKLPHNQDLADRDLAVFLTGTPEDGGLPQRPVLGAGVRAAQPRRDDGPALRGDAAAVRRGCTFAERISCHHNYVAEETYYGEDLLVTRKGAIRAGRGDLGIIPGSMGTGSYIVRGLGNPASFNSASHGAGRKMSRSQARKRFTLRGSDRTDRGGRVPQGHRGDRRDPRAYKDIDEVIAAQTDLVEVVTHLRQVVCVKG